MKEKMMKNKILIIIMFIIGLSGIIMISYNYVLSKIKLTFETVNMEIYGNKVPKEINQNSDKEKQIESKETNDEIPLVLDYFGYIEIPKINLKHGLVEENYKYNNVDITIQTIHPSNYPNEEKGNLILASHSGTSNISYFKNLYQLNNEDIVNIYYNNTKYVYKITNIYTQPKNGEVNIYRDKDKTVLTLITCTKNDDTTQTVYICEQISKEGV